MPPPALPPAGAPVASAPSQNLKLVASLLVGLGLLAFFLWRAPLQEVGATLARVQGQWVLAAVGLSLASYALRALRWGVILKPMGSAPATALIGCTAAGFATSTIFPGRVGELVRPLLLSRRTGLPAAGTLASIVTERLVDMAMLLALFAAGVMAAAPRLAPATAPALRQAALLAAVGLAAAFAFLLTLLHFRRTAVAGIAHLAPVRWRARVSVFLDHLLDGLEAVRSARRLAVLMAWSVVVWGSALVQIEVLSRGFGLSLGLSTSAVVMGVSVIGLAVPTPAGVGSFHAAIQFALATLLGFDLADATAFAIAHHAICFFPITVVGLAYMAAVGVRPAAARAIAAGK